MHSSFAIAALAAVAYAAPRPQGVTEAISPEASAPAGCSSSYSGKFQIAAVNVTAPAKRSLEARQSSCGSEGSLTLDLASGRLTDGQGRTGYIAANYQFQFDAPAQTGAIYTSGFSACSNSSLALGGSAVFYQCLSGEFYNLYDRSWAAQCNPVLLQILPCSGSTPSNGVGQVGDGQPTGTAVGAPVTQISDGQPQASTGVPVVSELPDGQPQAPTVMPAPVTQIGDGQVQAPTETAAPVTQIGDGQIQAPTSQAAPVTQIGDGQVQAPTGTAAPVTQISDGQVQAPTGTSAAAPVTQISDGQIQAPTGTPAPVTQISDGQVQAPTGTPAPAPITQISDGQIQAPTSTVSPVTQISDGQVQAPTGTGSVKPVNASSTAPIEFAGSASAIGFSSVVTVAVAGLITAFLL